MLRIQRLLLLAILALTFGLAVAPADALEAVPIPIRCGIIATGAGGTEAEALDNALDILRESYWVTSYTVVSSFCTETRIYTGNPLDPYDTIVLSSARVSACGILRPPHVLP